MFLVDSTLYIDLLRARRDPVQALGPWLVREEVLCCGVIRCEVLRGIINDKVHKRMQDLFDAVGSVETDNLIWEETARLAWTMDRRGIVVPLTDLIIACCALRARATIISSDEHFKEIPDLEIATALPTP